MEINISIFDRLVRREYEYLRMVEEPCIWTIDEVIHTFHQFFRWYQLFMDENHPPLTGAQIRKYIHNFPFCYWDNGYCGKPVFDQYGDVIAYQKDPEDLGEQLDLIPEDYDEIIPDYFTTKYQRGCNYRIHHFMSGSIRTYLLLHRGII